MSTLAHSRNEPATVRSGGQLSFALGGINMIRRVARMVGWIPLAVFAWVLSAGPATAQYQGYPVWPGSPYLAPVVAYDWSGIGSLYATYWLGSTLIDKNSAAARG